MRWLSEHRTFTAVAAIFLAVLIFLIMSYQMKDRGGPVGNAANTVISVVQKPVAALVDIIGDGIKSIVSDETLEAENEDLKQQVSDLQTDLIEQRLDREELDELRRLSVTFGTEPLHEQYKLAAANVLSYDNSNAFNVFTIDIGTESGVEVNDPVANGDGLIGRISSVGNGWSKVTAIIDDTNNVGFQIYNNLDYLGVVHGDGKGELTGYMLDEDAQVKDGDKIITSGIGGIYPAGLVIGYVRNTERTEDSPLLTVNVWPNVYFKGLKKVAVLV